MTETRMWHPGLSMGVQWRSDMTVTLKRSMASDAYVMEAAQVSTKDIQDEEYQRLLATGNLTGLINYLVRKRHGSPFEHCVFTFYVNVPMDVAREWMRHRIGTFVEDSYNEESSRYKELAPTFYLPPAERPLVQVGKPGAYQYVLGTTQQQEMVRESMQRACMTAYWEYKKLLNQGIAREVARKVLPMDIYTSFIWTVNARSLMNFISLRVDHPNATYDTTPLWEIQEAAQHVEAYFGFNMPIVYEAFCKHGRVQP